jgi:DHA1 family tetracycline resistance protein-like MFS transporter
MRALFRYCSLHIMQAHTSTQKFFVAAAPLLLVLFIDGMGLSLVFPLLSTLVMDPVNSILPLHTSEGMRNITYGFIVGIAMIAWLFGASYLGDLSDQIGRRKSLLICLIGAFLGYVASALGVIVGSVSLLLLGRIVAGLTAGSQAIAQAAIVDLSTPETKARNIGFILLACSLGFMLGPLIGGVLADNQLVSWFTFTTPFYFAAIISLLNALLLWFLFPETFYKTGKITVKFYRAIEILASAFKDHKVRNLSCILLAMIFGWSGYYMFIPVYLLRQYGFPPLETGIFMALMGLGFGVGTGALVNYFVLRFPLKKIVVGGLLTTAMLAVVTLVSTNSVGVWLSIAPLSAALGIAYSVLLTIFSNQVDANAQGWVMGITNAVMAVAFGINGLLMGVLATWGAAIPLIMTIIGLTLSAILMYLLHKPENVSPSIQHVSQ